MSIGMRDWEPMGHDHRDLVLGVTESPGDISQSDAMQHFAAKAIEDREADIRAVLGWVDMHPKWPLAKGRVNDLNDGIGHGDRAAPRCYYARSFQHGHAADGRQDLSLGLDPTIGAWSEDEPASRPARSCRRGGNVYAVPRFI